MPDASIPLEPNLPSPTLVVCSDDSFPVIVGVPSMSQLAVATPSVIVTTAPLTAPPALTTLPVGREDSLKFSFEATSITREVLGDMLLQNLPHLTLLLK